MQANPLISVIVPIYNMAPYLPRCVDSILAQTYKNLEIILVDDGSTDQSPQICRQYAQKDPRIQVVRQPNKGLPAARNTGIECSKGDFFAFVDADDWIDKNCYQLLMQQQQNTGAVLVSCDYYYAFDSHSSKHTLPKEVPPSFLEPEQFLLLLLTQRNWYAWNKMYSRDWVDQTRFDCRYTVAEDWYFISLLTKKGGRLAHVALPLYFYYQRPQSMIHSSNSRNWQLAFRLATQMYEDSLSGKHRPLQKALLGYACASASVLALVASLERPKNLACLLQARSFLLKHKLQTFKTSHMRLAGKCFALLLMLFPKITTWGCQLPLVNSCLHRALAKRVM